MTKVPKNQGKSWSKEDLKTLDKMSKTRPVGIIADELGRSKTAVYSKANAENISLSPPEKSPYGRPKKK